MLILPFHFMRFYRDLRSQAATLRYLTEEAILILDDLTQSLAARLHISPRKTQLNVGTPTGPVLNDVPIANLLNAAGNNFRHYNEWARIPWPYTPEVRREKRYRKAFLSIDVLTKALRIEGPVLTLMTGRVLDRMSLGSYALVENKMLRIPEELAARNLVHEGARRHGLHILANQDNASKPPAQSLERDGADG